MPVASRRTCTVPGCKSGPLVEGEDEPGPYNTHVEFATRAEVTEDLRDHVKMVHELPIRAQQVQVGQYQAENERLCLTPQVSVDDEIEPEHTQTSLRRSKLESIPRPKIQSSATRSDWGFFLAQWNRYVDGSGMSKPQQINQLWAACSEELQHSLHHGNSSSITEPSLLIENIMILAVKKFNNLVNVVEFQNFAQFNNETITAYATRLSGQANLCDMLVKCPKCAIEVSFKNKFVPVC